jgi:hypothetical protein
MLSAAWNQAGGVRYHLRAWRLRNSSWLPFRAALDDWLSAWQPNASTLAIVGPSGGYCLPLSPLERFARLIVFEPDPIARWVLRRRLLRELQHQPAITWIANDAWVEPLRRGGGVPEALLRHDTAILFSNFVGQLPFLVAPAEWSAWRDAWCRSLWPVLGRVPWVSFHDRVSGRVAPRVSMFASPRRLTDAEVAALYEPEDMGADRAGSASGGPPAELLDHRSLELLPEGHSYRYFDWPLTADTHHLIEGVVGGNY